jgi:hypothetical protein
MRERHFYFVVALILFFNVEIFSQIKTECIKLPINYNKAKPEFEKWLSLNYAPKNAAPLLRRTKGDSTTATYPALFVLSPSFYSDHLSFFCSKELKLEKISSIPFRFRVGSIDYVNYLEQKPNALRFQP